MNRRCNTLSSIKFIKKGMKSFSQKATTANLNIISKDYSHTPEKIRHLILDFMFLIYFIVFVLRFT